MKKTIIIVIIAVIVMALIFTFVMINSGSNLKTNLPAISSVEDLQSLVSKIYENNEQNLPKVDTQVLDISDSDLVKMFTGLENGNDLEYAVVSEPMITSVPYSMVLVKVKNGVSADSIAKTMCENINQRKWICVTADKVYATSSGNIAMLVMSNEEKAKLVYESFKNLAGTVGEEYNKAEEEIELPEELY